MTKYYDERHKFEQNRDIPISLPSSYDNAHDTRTYFCSICKKPLIKLSNYVGDVSYNVSYYCENKCVTDINPVEKGLKSESKITMSEGPIEDPAVTQLPDPDAAFHNKNKPVYQGGIKTLSEKGTIRITDYKESNTKNKGWRVTRLDKRDNH